jgi:hypothetical protein
MDATDNDPIAVVSGKAGTAASKRRVGVVEAESDGALSTTAGTTSEEWDASATSSR